MPSLFNMKSQNLDYSQGVDPQATASPSFMQRLMQYLNNNPMAMTGLATGLLDSADAGRTNAGAMSAAMKGFMGGRLADQENQFLGAQPGMEGVPPTIARQMLTNPEAMKSRMQMGLISRYLSGEGGGAAPQSSGGRSRALMAIMDPAKFAEMESRGEFGKEQFTQENTLRDEYAKAIAPFDIVSRSMRQIDQAYERNRGKVAEDASSPADMKLIFGYMKLLDPTSIVKEGEYATAERAGGVPSQVWQLYNWIRGGGRLSPQVRDQFYESSLEVYEGHSAEVHGHQSRYADLAKRYGLDPAHVAYEPVIYKAKRLGTTANDWQNGPPPVAYPGE